MIGARNRKKKNCEKLNVGHKVASAAFAIKITTTKSS